MTKKQLIEKLIEFNNEIYDLKCKKRDPNFYEEFCYARDLIGDKLAKFIEENK